MSDIQQQEEPHQHCVICARLGDYESAYQKHGREEDNTSLPAAANSLEVVKDFKPHSSRLLQLKRCPQCKTYYLYRTDYEFLVNGSEEEDYLTRLTDEAAREYLERPVPE